MFGNVATFFSDGTYDKSVVSWTERNKQPLAAVELLTSQTLNYSSPGFLGPLLVSFLAPLFHGEGEGSEANEGSFVDLERRAGYWGLWRGLSRRFGNWTRTVSQRH